MDQVKGLLEKVEKDSLQEVINNIRQNRAIIDLDHAHSEEDLNNKKDKRAMRKYYARSTFALSCLWLSLVLSIVLLAGWHLWGFSLTQAVLITLLSTTTANILGILLIVMAYIYKD